MDKRIIGLSKIKIGESIQLFSDVWAIRVTEYRFGYLIVNKKRAFLIDGAYPETVNQVFSMIEKMDVEETRVILTSREMIEPYELARTLNSLLKDSHLIVNSKDVSTKDLKYSEMCEDVLIEYGIGCWHFSGISPGSTVISYARHGGVIFAGNHAIGSPFSSGENKLSRPLLSPTSDENLITGWENLNIDIRHILPNYGKPILELRSFEKVADVILDLINYENVLLEGQEMHTS